jgi:predicted DNA-binding transcriptional regulator YafY
MNESVYYNVDFIHTAINQNMKIRFKYYRWDISKKLVATHNGEEIHVSPWALVWDDENYYMVAIDDSDEKIKHYRVDKMKNITITDEKRVGRNDFREFNLAEYAKMSFGMYGGERTRVKLTFKEEMVGVLLDRFGTSIPIRANKNEGWFDTEVDVALSDQFLGWIFALGDGVRITGPKKVVTGMKDKLNDLGDIY